jgi:HIRAN domain
MGLWDKVKAAFVGPVEPLTVSEPSLSLVTPEPKRPPDAVVEPVRREPVVQSQPPPQVRNYEAEKVKAAAAGQSVKSYRAGYVPPEAAKSQLVAGPDGVPPLRLVPSDNGLDLALPDGELVDYKTLALRHFQIFAFRVVGMGFYEDPNKPFKFRNGQRVQAVREPDNEHDANAVAIHAGRPRKKIGYVNKQRAAWVAKMLDAGHELDGIIIQSKAASPRVLLTTPEMLAYLQRD